MALIDRLPRLFRTTAYTAMVVQVTVLTLAAAVVATLLLSRFNTLMTRQVVETLRTEALGLTDLARSGGRDAVESAIAERVKNGGSNLYILIDSADRKVAGNLNRWPPELRNQSEGGLFRYLVEGPGGPTHRLAAGLPVPMARGLNLVVARDIEEQRAFAEDVRNLVIAGLVLLTLVGIVVGTLASRYVLKRIATVTSAADSIMAGNVSGRIPRNGSGDEIDDLAGRLNLMLDRIEQLLQGMREISDNIAHDLKTPLNRLRNRAEAALRDAEGGPVYREGLQRTIEAADDILKTFNALLLIARLEAGALEGAVETFDVAAALRDLAELYEPVAEDAGFDLIMEVTSDVPLTANRHLIVQATANLIDNAIKYGAPADGARAAVIVSLRTKGESVELSVADRGSGIPAVERARVFERFVRLEASRTRPGTGLGLSLVAAVARLHGGEVELADNEPGLKVMLRLPARAKRPTDPVAS